MIVFSITMRSRLMQVFFVMSAAVSSALSRFGVQQEGKSAEI